MKTKKMQGKFVAQLTSILVVLGLTLMDIISLNLFYDLFTIL
jgi:hypothetical protein